MSEEKELCIVDGDRFVWSSCLPIPQLNEAGEKLRDEVTGNIIYQPEKTFAEVEQCWNDWIEAIIKEVNTDNLKVFIGGKGSYRKLIVPSYKSGRKGMERPEKLDWLQDKLLKEGKAFCANGYETDDLVLSCNKLHENSFILTNDQDLLYTEGKRFNWNNKTWMNCTREEEISKFCEDMILGQKGDSVPGLFGKGKAFWNKVLAFHVEVISQNIESLYQIVLDEYILYYSSVKKGTEEYIRTYNQLKILNDLNLDILK